MPVSKVRFLLSVQCTFIAQGAHVGDVYGSDDLPEFMDGNIREDGTAVTDSIFFEPCVLAGDHVDTTPLEECLTHSEIHRWAAEARRQRRGSDSWVALVACYDGIFVEEVMSEETEYDTSAEFLGWVDWAKVIDFAGAIAIQGTKS